MNRPFSKDEILQRKKTSIDSLISLHPEILDGDELTRAYFFRYLGKDIPPEGWEFLLWENLSEEFYWDSLDAVNKLHNTNKLSYSPAELEKLTETLIQQAFEGKKIAAQVPVFSDIFLLIGNCEISPLSSFVQEEHKIRAINKGFWHCLAETANEPGYDRKKCLTTKQDYAGQELQFGCLTILYF